MTNEKISSINYDQCTGFLTQVDESINNEISKEVISGERKAGTLFTSVNLEAIGLHFTIKESIDCIDEWHKYYSHYSEKGGRVLASITVWTSRDNPELFTANYGDALTGNKLFSDFHCHISDDLLDLLGVNNRVNFYKKLLTDLVKVKEGKISFEDLNYYAEFAKRDVTEEFLAI